VFEVLSLSEIEVREREGKLDCWVKVRICFVFVFNDFGGIS
jgi:hypothetical protein